MRVRSGNWGRRTEGFDQPQFHMETLSYISVKEAYQETSSWGDTCWTNGVFITQMGWSGRPWLFIWLLGMAAFENLWAISAIFHVLLLRSLKQWKSKLWKRVGYCRFSPQIVQQSILCLCTVTHEPSCLLPWSSGVPEGVFRGEARTWALGLICSQSNMFSRVTMLCCMQDMGYSLYLTSTVWM